MKARSIIAARLDGVCRNLVDLLGPIVKGGAADLCVLAGVASIVYGLWLVAKPAAWMFAGLVCIVIGLRGVQPPKAGA